MESSWTYELDWNVSLTKSVRKVEEWFQNLTAQVFNESTSFKEFNWFYNDDIYNEFQTKLNNRRIIEKHSKSFQQFFCSQTNIQSMFYYGTLDAMDPANILFIEPSCGDGRVMKYFMLNGCTIFGCDIEKSITSQIRFDSYNDYDMHNLVLTSDFLLTTREDYVTRFQRRFNTESQPQQLVVVGCPPYSQTVETSPECNQDIDMITEFYLHCAHKINADKIVFVVSKRCGTSRYVDKLSEKFNSQCNDDKLWKLVQMTDADNRFEIPGSRDISQPSILQVWQKVIITD
jgi:hypothetical protein